MKKIDASLKGHQLHFDTLREKENKKIRVDYTFYSKNVSIAQLSIVLLHNISISAFITAQGEPVKFLWRHMPPRIAISEDNIFLPKFKIESYRSAFAKYSDGKYF